MSIGYGVHLLLGMYDHTSFVFAYQLVHQLSRLHIGTHIIIDVCVDLLRNLGMVVVFLVYVWFPLRA